jgi:hypothetical protein
MEDSATDSEGNGSDSFHTQEKMVDAFMTKLWVRCCERASVVLSIRRKKILERALERLSSIAKYKAGLIRDICESDALKNSAEAISLKTSFAWEASESVIFTCTGILGTRPGTLFVTSFHICFIASLRVPGFEVYKWSCSLKDVFVIEGSNHDKNNAAIMPSPMSPSKMSFGRIVIVLHSSEELIFTPSGLDGMASGRVGTFINQIVQMVHGSKNARRTSASTFASPDTNAPEDSDTDRSEDDTRGSGDGFFGFRPSIPDDSEAALYWDLWRLWSCPLCQKITQSRSQLLKHVERCAHSRVSLMPVAIERRPVANLKGMEMPVRHYSVRNRVKKIFEKSMAADEMGSSSSVLQAKTRRRNYRRFTRRLRHPRFAEVRNLVFPLKAFASSPCCLVTYYCLSMLPSKIVQIIDNFINAMEKRLGVLEDFELTPDEGGLSGLLINVHSS